MKKRIEEAKQLVGKYVDCGFSKDEDNKIIGVAVKIPMSVPLGKNLLRKEFEEHGCCVVLMTKDGSEYYYATAMILDTPTWVARFAYPLHGNGLTYLERVIESPNVDVAKDTLTGSDILDGRKFKKFLLSKVKGNVTLYLE